ncbi:hypothetical protein [Streptomyces sp. NPDC096311]|uniref:hypothetical protein n=1 Tax=Streptomyces sp. NPDC096311 TaxID=3366083 RepID=UPI00382B9C9F
MALYPEPAGGSWTEHSPDLGTGVVSYEDCVSPEFYEVEREAVFKRAWLNDGRVEELPRKGSCFTKEIEVADTSIIVVRVSAPPVSDTLLPEAFAELESFAATWCLAIEPERYERRLASDMTELQVLYDAGFPRIEEALAHCDTFPLDALPGQARRLLELVHSIIMVSMCVETWHQPRVVDGANAEIHRVAEPLP